MLVDQTNYDEFIAQFIEKFNSFCSRSPFLMSYKINPNACYIIDARTKEVKRFDLDYTKSVFENIAVIKKWLIKNKYPVLKQKIEDTTIPWRIEKVNIKKGSLLIHNLVTDQIFNYKIRMPLMTFLENILQTDKEKAFDLFKERGQLIEEIGG